jgi:hypothetical protein
MKTVTLSFDNGPDPDVTPRVLDILAERGILTSFSVVSAKLLHPGAPPLLQRMLQAGHWLGNHTFSHDPPLGVRGSPVLAEEEISRTQQLLGELSHDDRLFRPSGTKVALDERLLDASCLRALIEGNYSCVLWHAVPGDLWPATDWIANAEAAIEEREWTLLVLHDIKGGCIARFAEFLDLLADRGVSICQELPPDCVAILRGQVVHDMSRYVQTGRP